MSRIKCPNCGKQMISMHRGTEPEASWMSCCLEGGCGVRGPIADNSRIAARLMREWLAKMKKKKDDACYESYKAGFGAGLERN